MRILSKALVMVTLIGLTINLATLEGTGSNEELSPIPPEEKLSPDLKNMSPDNRGDVSFIVQFTDGPTERDRRLMEELSFRIDREFQVVPAFSVRGSENRIQELAERPRVTYIEHNDEVVLDMEMGTQVINATQVWSSVIDSPTGYDQPITGNDVTVCVVDTGIDAGHPDLDYQEKTIFNVFDAGGGVWVEAPNTDTNYGHGTHVAGTVAGNGHASAGARRGVAPGANLVGITVSLPEEGSTPTEDGYIQGLEWVFDHSRPGSNPHNIRVVTNSWHSTVEEYNPDSMLTKVIERLSFENNVVSTWSAGNDGRDDPEGQELTTSGQGNAPVAIMVAAYERDGSAVTDFSSRGRVGANHTYPDVGAPGRSIWSTSARRTVISGGSYMGGNTNPYYLAISGTSMSTPHVAGLVALLWEAAPSMSISEMHEDYSGEDPEGWYSNENTRIHDAEWILEASARFLPPTESSGNVAGDTDTTGWWGKPVDYVQGYGIVDAKRAVGIALTLERLRSMCSQPDTISVGDAIRAYDGQEVAGKKMVGASLASISWSGEYSRYNDQTMNPLSLVNQTKYLIVPEGASSVTVQMSYAGLDTSQFSAGDLAFTIDTDGDGNPDVQSSLSVTDGGRDQEIIESPTSGRWTFGIIGRGVKLPRPLQGVNYVELRMEYDLSVSMELQGNGSHPARALNAVYAPLLPDEGVEGDFQVEVMEYDLRDLKLPSEEEKVEKAEEKPPWGLIILIILGLIIVLAYIFHKRKKKTSKDIDD